MENNFIVKSIVRWVRTFNVLFQIPKQQYNNYSDVLLASSIVSMDLISDVIRRNGKTYLAVKTVNAKFEIGNMSTLLQSQKLSPIIMGLINKTLNTQCRDHYEKIQSEIEDFICRIYQSIVSSLLDKMAVEDFFQ